jgi:hypothetical protein
LPKGRQAANDRAPTIEEIRKLVEYPDRRIKPIVYTMISSGICLGVWDYFQWKHIEPITYKLVMVSQDSCKQFDALYYKSNQRF